MNDSVVFFYIPFLSECEEMTKPAVALSLERNMMTVMNIQLQHKTKFFISQILAAEDSISAAISKVLQTIGENFGWEVGCFWRDGIEAHGYSKSNFPLSDVDFPDEVWKNRKPQCINDLANSTNFSRASFAIKTGLQSAIAFPIHLDEKMLGIMEFFSKNLIEFDNNLMQTLDIIGNQVGQFIKRKEAEERLRVANEKLEQRVQERTAELVKSNQALQEEIIERKKVEKEILEIALKEQRRFGSQLHDGLCQELTGILMFAKGLTQKMEKENCLDIAELKKISDLINEAVGQARDTAHGLYPGELNGSSLMNMLNALVLKTEDLSKISCRFFCPQQVFVDENDIATHLYKIAQEGIGNAVKHGRPQAIEVSLIQNNGEMILTIKDDGVGFVYDPAGSKGIGLKIMKYRAHMMNASFQLKSNMPHGVVLTCSLKGTA